LLVRIIYFERGYEMNLGADIYAVLVRRVVEARKIHANGGLLQNRTAILPPPTQEKEKPRSSAPAEQKTKAPKENLWKRLKCW
jgi:GTPase KRas protein